jgi:ribonuclease H / adenosylcobalamin/alpha-ribazole phosphatase
MGATGLEGVMVRQMKGLYHVRAPTLIPLAAKLRAQIERYEEVVFEWVPRRRNKAADMLSKFGLQKNV